MRGGRTARERSHEPGLAQLRHHHDARRRDRNGEEDTEETAERTAAATANATTSGCGRTAPPWIHGCIARSVRDNNDAAVITVRMADAGDGRTSLMLHVSGVAGQPGDDSVYGGWREALDHLVEQAT